MAKMASLHADGVRDLESYSIGYEDAVAKYRKTLESIVAQFGDGVLANLNGAFVLKVLLSSLQEDDEDE